MLVDVTRRPVRLIFEECPTVVVIRSLGLQGRADGLLHQIPLRDGHKVETLVPAARSTQNEREFIETIVTAPIKLRQLRPAIRAAILRDDPNPEPLPDEPCHVVSGYMDQVLGQGGVWRLNFLFDRTASDTRLMTVIDETHSTTLFSVRVPNDHPGFKELTQIHTPLQRALKQATATGGLWNALLEDD